MQDIESDAGMDDPLPVVVNRGFGQFAIREDTAEWPIENHGLNVTEHDFGGDIVDNSADLIDRTNGLRGEATCRGGWYSVFAQISELASAAIRTWDEWMVGAAAHDRLGEGINGCVSVSGDGEVQFYAV